MTTFTNFTDFLFILDTIYFLMKTGVGFYFLSHKKEMIMIIITYCP